MGKVWAVVIGDYSDYRILCVCPSQWDAEEIVAKYIRLENLSGDDYVEKPRVEEYPLLIVQECCAKAERTEGWAHLRWPWDAPSESENVLEEEDHEAAVRVYALTESFRLERQAEREKEQHRVLAENAIIVDLAAEVGTNLMVLTRKAARERGGYETILRKGEVEHCIQEYATLVAAQSGHEKWVGRLTGVDRVRDCRTKELVELRGG